MDNYPIAQVFSEIADLLEIKGENLFKIRAYRSAADTIRAWADPVARMDEKQLLENYDRALWAAKAAALLIH